MEFITVRVYKILLNRQREKASEIPKAAHDCWSQKKQHWPRPDYSFQDFWT